MSDSPVIVGADGKAVTLPAALAPDPAGLSLSIQLPNARKLLRARLSLAAVSTTAADLTVTADTDGTSTAPAPAPAPAHWWSVTWDGERAITGVTLTAPNATLSSPACGARVRMLSAGNWLPLPARDTLSFADVPKVGNNKVTVAAARFPACAASGLMIDLLAENKVGATYTGVLVPGAVNLADASASVQATPQPCHVSLAIGDDAPFFTCPGPLPAQAVAVDGLLRALNRYLFDHPGATLIPLTLRAASAGQALQLLAFDAEQEAAPAPLGSTPPPPPPPPRDESTGPQPIGKLTLARGRWCDASHAVAQSFESPPAGSGLSAVEIFVRPLVASGTVSGRLGVHADAGGVPAVTPLLAPVPWQIHINADRLNAEAWLRCELPLPAVVPAGRWWAVLRVNAGELLWYLSDIVPKGVGDAVCQIESGAWLPAAPGAGGWLQSRLRLIAVAQAAPAAP